MIAPEAALVPTVEDLRQYVKGSEALPLADLELAHNSALDNQAHKCVTAPYTWALRNAALRRGARKLAAMGAPLSTLDMGPLGSVPVSRWDAVIEEDEGPYRYAPIGGGRPVEEVNPL
jgi:hypothetical protein